MLRHVHTNRHRWIRCPEFNISAGWLVFYFLMICIFFTASLIGLSIFLQPQFAVNFLASKFPKVLFSVETDEKIIALTIDDSPSANTERILEILAAHNSRATFFILGSRIDGREHILQSMLRAKHELGNHLVNDQPSIDLGEEEFRKQLMSVEKRLERFRDRPRQIASSRWFRPGSAYFNAKMLNNLDDLGFQLVLGNVYPSDPQLPYPALIKAHIIARARPGAIIVLHDLKTTADALDDILTELVDNRGYKVVTLSELTANETTSEVTF
uniref:Cystathionine beta-lyase n=1 Tax=Hirondellea gigas TaxID=1518452 RepID=A0A6A7G5I8_9CRUS